LKTSFGGSNSSWRRWNCSKWMVVLLLVGLIVGRVDVPRSAAAQGSLDADNIARATVFLAGVYDVPGGRAISCVGTGTFVSSDGLILTNAHNVTDSVRCPVDDIAVSLTLRLGEPPVPTYYAEVVDYNLGLDLAVLRVAREIDGRVIDRSMLSLPFVELGDSNQLRLDDTITVFGYPGLGEDPVESTRGTVVGFLAEANVGERAWIKTEASIPGVMSGGGAFDSQGRLIGIPTTAPAGTSGTALDCRRVQDTNGDSLVDSRDNCIPVAGFINALRPAALARGLVRAAQWGIRDRGHQFSGQVVAPAGDSAPTFGRLFFSPAVNEAGLPTTRVTQLPAGANSLYLFFDFANMRPGTVYELRVTVNGIPNPRFSLSPALWSGPERGLWYIGSSGQPWPNGTYEFTLFIEGIPVGDERITIGGPAQATPQFSDIAFGLLDFRGNVVGSGYVLPSGNVASALFIYRDMIDGIPWEQVWYYEGVEVPNGRVAGTWNLGPNGSTTISISNAQGLQPGRYRLELSIQGALSATADFVIAGAQQGAFAQVFENLRVANLLTDETLGSAGSTSFPNTITDLYALIDWRLLAPNTPWTYRWLLDGSTLFEHTEGWVAPESGSNFWIALGSDLHLPDGTYTLELRVGDLPPVTVSARVGLGQLPVVQGNTASGVRMSGQIVDAQTGEGIPGALFILLEAEFSVQDFVWDESQIFGVSLSDSQGRFEIARLLPRDALYSVVVVAAGYLPVSADGIVVEADAQEPVILRLEMNRDL